MGQEGIYVGIDVAKAKVDVAVRPTRVQFGGRGPPETAQEGPQSLPSRKRGVGWRLDYASER